MSRHNNEPDWLDGEVERASQLHKSGQKVNNPTATKPKMRKSRRSVIPQRTLKGFRIREDYQQRYDILAATVKHTEGKKGPDLIEEALELLFKKYNVVT